MRDKKLVSGFLSTGFEYKGVEYKPLTTRTLMALEAANSPFYFGGSDLKGVMDLLFVSCNPSKDILDSIRSGTFDELVWDFAEGFTPEDISNLKELITKQNEDAAAALVEVRESAGDSKKK